MNVVIIDGFGELILIQITKQLVRLLGVYLVDGDLRQSLGTLASSHFSRVRLRAEQNA
jgi:hypothetical protein